MTIPEIILSAGVVVILALSIANLAMLVDVKRKRK